MNEGNDKISSGNHKLVSTLCTICKSKFSSETELLQHKSWCQYLCSVCGKSFENSQLYKEHKCKRFLCRECIESFETKVELTAHMKMHSAPIHCVIPSCREKTYTSKLMLRDHIFNKHTKQVKFRNGKQPWLCLLDGFSHICSGSYNGRFKILRHISSVAQYKPFNCPECPKSFSVEYRVNEHLKKIHAVVGDSWTCCGKEFPMKSLFRVHARTFCPTKGRLATINFRNLNKAEIDFENDHLRAKRIVEVKKESGSKTSSTIIENGALLKLRVPKLALSCPSPLENMKPRIKREKKRKAGVANIGNIARTPPFMSTAGCDRFDTSYLFPRKRPTLEWPSKVTMVKRKDQAIKKPLGDNERKTQFLWDELPKLAIPDFKLQKNFFCEKIPNNERPHLKKSNSDEKGFKHKNFCATPFSDTEISARVKLPLVPCPIKKKHKPQVVKQELRSKNSLTNGKLPKLSDLSYKPPKPKLLQISSAHKSAPQLSALCSAKDKYDYKLPLLGDLTPRNQVVDSTKLLTTKDSCPKVKKELQTNNLPEETSMSSVLSHSTPLRTKMCKSNLTSQLEVAEKKLQAIRLIVSGWEVKGKAEDIQMLLKEIKRNL